MTYCEAAATKARLRAIQKKIFCLKEWAFPGARVAHTFGEGRERRGNVPIHKGHVATRPPPQELPIPQPEKFSIKVAYQDFAETGQQVPNDSGATLLAIRRAPVLPKEKLANCREKKRKSSLKAPVLVGDVLNPENSETVVNQPPESFN